MEHLLELILICLFPGIELRGSIPIGILVFGMDPLLVIPISIIINILLIPFSFFVFDVFWKVLSRISLFNKYVNRLRKKSKPHLKKYGFWGLLFFVAIPLPATGAYTGSLVAWLVGIDRKKAFLAITVGIIIAAALVSAITLGALGALEWLL